jgi:hypothetical protein
MHIQTFFEVIVIACSLHMPSSCESYLVRVMSRKPSFYECYKEPVPIIQSWLAFHPGYKVRLITCGKARISS